MFIYIINIILIISLTGCKPIPFEKFILGEEIEKDIEINSLDIDKINISVEEIESIQKIVDEIFNTIGEKDYYYHSYSKTDIYLSPIKKHLNETFYNQLISNGIKNDFKKVIDNIYYKDNTVYYSAKVIEMYKTAENGNSCAVEIVSIGDTKDFMTSTIKLYFDKDNKINKTEIISENNMVSNTTTPLSKESLISNNLSKEKSIITNFFNSMKNKELYNIVSSNTNNAELQLDTLVNNLSIEIKSIEDLKSLFKSARGAFENYYLVEYSINDISSMANSNLTFAFVNGKVVEKYTLVYSRVTNEIINVKKVN